MTLQELEQQLLSLPPAEKHRIIQLLTQNLSAAAPPESLTEFFRRSPLCDVADKLDLSRDPSPVPDRFTP